jgi:hypothetical protein
MKVNILRKILVILVVIIPVFSDSGCKKQPRCGCGKDELFTISERSAYVYFKESSSNVYFILITDPYSTYNFCNPGQWRSKLLSDYKTGDELVVSGHVYWNCAFLQQAANSPYQSPYKSYDVEVTDVYMDMFGKK